MSEENITLEEYVKLGALLKGKYWRSHHEI